MTNDPASLQESGSESLLSLLASLEPIDEDFPPIFDPQIVVSAPGPFSSLSDWYCEELLSGRESVEKLFEDDSVIAFWHTRPHYAHHAVVTPKHHVDSLLTADPGTLNGVLEVARAIAAQFLAEYGGAHVVTNLGAYQDSKHFNVHHRRGPMNLGRPA